MRTLKIILLIMLWIVLFLVILLMGGYFVLTDFNYRENETLKIDFYIHASIIFLLFVFFIYYTIYSFKIIKKSKKDL